MESEAYIVTQQNQFCLLPIFWYDPKSLKNFPPLLLGIVWKDKKKRKLVYKLGSSKNTGSVSLSPDVG